MGPVGDFLDVCNRYGRKISLLWYRSPENGDKFQSIGFTRKIFPKNNAGTSRAVLGV